MKTFDSDAALVLVDIQNDFCPGGALPVPEGDEIVPIVNQLLPLFHWSVATQDWHPPDHCSFRQQGGPWPPHCIQNTPGAELHSELDASRISLRIRKGFVKDREAYSGFDGVNGNGISLNDVLRQRGIATLYVAGLATEYCVRSTVLDGLRLGYKVFVVSDGMRAVDVHPGDGDRALQEMSAAGARLTTSTAIAK